MSTNTRTPLNDLSDSNWHGLEPAAKPLMFWFGLLPFLIPIVPASVLSLTLMPGWWGLCVTLPVAVLCLAIGVQFGRNRWHTTRWRLDADGFRLRKGRWWQKEIFVPRTRVQHLDIHNGPMERSRGLATLIIHTAGTESHALKQQGFSLETAVQLRDALIPEQARDDSAL
jgi:membrane protein YdbS with pleckstrin-like domain